MIRKMRLRFFVNAFRASACALLTAASCLAAPSASAGGLKTHLWVAQELISELETNSCTVAIGSARVPVPPDVCNSILQHRREFLAGAWGPDIFPDVVTGQVTTHPGAPPFSTADWLEAVHRDASAGRELAYSSGYLTHAAVDAFMHTYVNAYTGNVFDLRGERRNEIRHFTLEKYIDQKLPESVDTNAPAPPVEFVVRRLLYSTMAERSAARAGTPGHIAAMNKVRKSVDELHEEVERIDELARKALKRYVDAHLRALDGLKASEDALRIARENLRIQQQALDVARGALDRANRALRDIEGAYERILDEISVIEKNVAGLERLVDDGRKKIQGMLELKLSLQQRVNQATEGVSSAMLEPIREVCRSVERIFRVSWLKKVARWVTRCEQVKVLEAAQSALADAVSKLQAFEAGLAREQADQAAKGLKLAAEVAARVESSRKEVALRQAKASRKAAVATAEVSLKAQALRVRESRKVVDRALAEVRRVRADVDLYEFAKKETDKLIDQLKLLSLYTDNWRSGIQKAGVEYIKTSAQIGRTIASGGDGAISQILEWLDCYGSAFTPAPYQFSETKCKAEKVIFDNLARIEAAYQDLVIDILPPPVDDLYKEVLSLRVRLRSELKTLLEDALVELVALSTDRSTASLVEYMSHPEKVDSAALDREFASVADSGGVAYLAFSSPYVTALINKDIGLKRGVLSPSKFKALKHSLTLAKLALLDADGLRLLAYRLGSDPGLMGVAGSARYSILWDALRSIDGNHAWQPYGLPYPRSSGRGEPLEPAERRYGFGAKGDTRRGFVFFRDPVLRREVFPAVFPGAMGGALMTRAELNPPNYSFPECERNPFPVAMEDDGAAAQDDLRCEARSASPNRSSAAWRGFWRRLFRSNPE